MKVLFVTAVDGLRYYHKRIVDHVIKRGDELVTDHYLSRKISEIKDETEQDSEEYIRKFRRWLRDSDVVIFETSRPDISVGYEIAIALSMLKQTIVMYHKKVGHIPHGLKGIHSEKFQLVEYDEYSLESSLDCSLEMAHEDLSIRFNFIISSQMNNFLEDASKTERINKSTLLRRLVLNYSNKFYADKKE
jgi:hypothetical protein